MQSGMTLRCLSKPHDVVYVSGDASRWMLCQALSRLTKLSGTASMQGSGGETALQPVVVVSGAQARRDGIPRRVEHASGMHAT